MFMTDRETVQSDTGLYMSSIAYHRAHTSFNIDL